MKHITTIILGSLLSLNLGIAHAGQATVSMSVTATVVDSCTHTLTTEPSNTTSPISSKCSTGTAYTAQVKKAPAESKQLNTQTNTVETVKTNENTRIVEIMY